jgi:hypothetical protein
LLPTTDQWSPKAVAMTASHAPGTSSSSTSTIAYTRLASPRSYTISTCAAQPSSGTRASSSRRCVATASTRSEVGGIALEDGLGFGR